MTIEQMKKKKLELGLTAEMIADQSGVPVSTVRTIMVKMLLAIIMVLLMNRLNPFQNL